jgi:hypothetical protein
MMEGRLTHIFSWGHYLPKVVRGLLSAFLELVTSGTEIIGYLEVKVCFFRSYSAFQNHISSPSPIAPFPFRLALYAFFQFH